MQTKPLLYGLIGFFLGGLLVSVAAMMYQNDASKTNTTASNMSMNDMTTHLKGKTGDEYDRAFITSMIAHHEGAVEMAKLSGKNAKHEEIKALSANIILAQEKEIKEMKRWQKEWGYSSAMMNHGSMSQE